MKQLSDAKDLKTWESWGDIVYCEAADSGANSAEIVQDNQAEIVRGLVSLIMPVYNTPDEYLEMSVDSVLNQTYKNLELLIVDDGSRTECAKSCDRLGINEKVTVFHISNSGVSAARNFGINQAKGEYIAFIDSDDTMEDDAIRIMVEEIKDVDFVTIGCRHVKAINNTGYSNSNGKIYAEKKKCIEYLCYMNPPYDCVETNAVWGKLYRKELLGNLCFDQDMVMAEDFKFNFDYIMQTGNGKYLDYTGYNYLEHGDSISRSYRPKMMKTINAVERMAIEYKNDAVYDALLSRSLNIAFTILMMVPNDLRNERKRIERFISTYRNRVVRNPLTKKKVRIACLTSYFGYGLTRKIFEMIRR